MPQTATLHTELTSSECPARVLLIEDGKGDAILIERALDLAVPGAYSIEHVTTLESALHALSKEVFDVALLDRSLPDVEGFQGLNNLASFAPQLPIVFLTSYKDEQTACEAIRQGAQDYLFKDVIDGHAIKRALQYAILRKEFECLLITRANYDVLTGLANRMLFESRLDAAYAQAKRFGNHVAVLFLDLDGFKGVNDTLGHSAGDVLLKEFAQRLKKVFRPYDTVARFGGDEFAILLEKISGLNHCEVVAQKTIKLLDQPFQISDQEMCIGVSIGIAICSSNQEKPIGDLIGQADKAMYEAKRGEGSCYRIFKD